MASLNQATIIGFLGDNPKINTTSNGRKGASFAVATTEKGYTAQNGTQVPDKTEWHNVVMWGKLAEVAERFLHKGSSVFVQGKMKTRSYEDRNGMKRYVTEIEADIMQMLDKKPESTQNTSASTNYRPSQQPQPQPQNQHCKKDDDLPF